MTDSTNFGSFLLILAVIFATELTGLTCIGVFVCLVTKGSPAALGGLRFGDQILQVNGENLAGFSSDKVLVHIFPFNALNLHGSPGA